MEIFGKDTKMTIRNGKRHLVMVLAAAVVLLSMTPGSCKAEADEDIWSDEAPGPTSRRFKMSDEKIEELLDKTAKEHPERAKELRELRKNNPEQFRTEMRQMFFAQRRELREHPGEGPGVHERPGMGPSGVPGMHPKEPMRGREGGEGRRERWRERIARRHEEYIEWLKADFPEEAQKLVRLREKDPETYAKRIMASMRKYVEIMDAQKKNPELAEVLKEELELKQNRDKLLTNIDTSKGKQRKKLEQQLEELVNLRFDLIVRKKQLRYEDLRRKLEQLQKQVKQREAEVEKLKNKKARFIRERLEELTNKTEKISWD